MNNPQRFANQVAIITGGTSGIGLAVARRLREEGATVAIFDLNSAAFADLTAEFGAAGMFLKVNVTAEAEVRSAVAAH